MPADLTTDLVAADMERIFGPLTRRPDDRPFPHQHKDNPTSDAGTGRRMMRYAILTLLVVAVLAAISIVIHPTSLTAFIQDRVFALDNGSRKSAAVHSPPLQPVDAGSAVPVSSNDLGQADDAMVGPVPNDPGNDGNPMTAKPMAVTSDQASVSPERPATNKSARAKETATKVDAVARVLANDRPRLAPSACLPGSTENRCIYKDVIYADTTLRIAYNRAKDAGVSKAVLAAVGARWQQALQRSLDDPDGTIDRYNQLAATLDRQREDMAP